MSEELLHSYDKELSQLNITCERPTSHRGYKQLLSKIPIVCLRIPNKFFLVADRKRHLEKLLNAGNTSDLSDLVNNITEGRRVKISSNASKVYVEQRLVRKSQR